MGPLRLSVMSRRRPPPTPTWAPRRGVVGSQTRQDPAGSTNRQDQPAFYLNEISSGGFFALCSYNIYGSNKAGIKKDTAHSWGYYTGRVAAPPLLPACGDGDQAEHSLQHWDGDHGLQFFSVQSQPQLSSTDKQLAGLSQGNKFGRIFYFVFLNGKTRQWRLEHRTICQDISRYGNMMFPWDQWLILISYVCCLFPSLISLISSLAMLRKIEN